MAFKIPNREVVLIFEGDYEAAEVVCRSAVSMATFLQFQNIEDDLEAGFRKFGEDVLLRWDLEDDSGALPADGDGMMRLPPDLATAILGSWSDQISNPRQGSEPESLNGSTSAEQPTLKAI